MKQRINIKIFILFSICTGLSIFLYGCGLGQVSKTNKLKSNLYYRLGAGYFSNGNYVKAMQEFIRAKTLNPVSAKNYNAIGMVYMLTHRQNKAVKNFKRAIAINHEFSYAYYNLSLIYIKKKQYKKAAINLKNALSNPFYNDPYESYTQLAKIYLIENNLVKARKYLLVSEALNKKYFLTYYYFGDYYFKKGRLNFALINYKKVLELDIYYTPAMFKEALIYFELKNYKKSAAMFKKVYQINQTAPLGVESHDYLLKIKKLLH